MIYKKYDKVPFYKEIDGKMNAIFGCKCRVVELFNKFIVQPLEDGQIIYTDKVYSPIKPIHYEIDRTFDIESTEQLH